jgi:hypothetical protein
MFGTEGDLEETVEEVARLKVTEFLGRNRYERRQRAHQAKAGSHNGYSALTVRPPPGPSPWSGRNSATPPTHSPLGSLGPGSLGRTPWSRW